MRRELSFDSASQRSRTKDQARRISSITPQDFKPDQHVRVAEALVATLDSRTDVFTTHYKDINVAGTTAIVSLGPTLSIYDVGGTVIKKRHGLFPGRRKLVFSSHNGENTTSIAYKTNSEGKTEVKKIRSKTPRYIFSYDFEPGNKKDDRPEKHIRVRGISTWETVWKKGK